MRTVRLLPAIVAFRIEEQNSHSALHLYQRKHRVSTPCLQSRWTVGGSSDRLAF